MKFNLRNNVRSGLMLMVAVVAGLMAADTADAQQRRGNRGGNNGGQQMRVTQGTAQQLRIGNGGGNNGGGNNAGNRGGANRAATRGNTAVAPHMPNLSQLVQNRGQSGGGQGGGAQGGGNTRNGMGIRLPEGVQQQLRPHVGRQLGGLGIVDSIEVPTRPRPGIGNSELPGLIPGGRPDLQPFDPPGFDRPVRPGTGGIDIPGLRPGNRPGVIPGNRPDWQNNQDEHCHDNTPHHEIVDRCRNVRRNLRLHWSYDRWCRYYRNECHWWFNYCGPTYYFDPTCSIVHNWYYYPCQTYVHGVYHYYKWHLGINAVYIPGRGLGIQEVEVGSPAYYAGLRPGMIILATNGVSLIDETVFPRIVEQSSCGSLSLSVIADASGQVYTVNVRMQKIVLSGSNY